MARSGYARVHLNCLATREVPPLVPSGRCRPVLARTPSRSSPIVAAGAASHVVLPDTAALPRRDETVYAGLLPGRTVADVQ